MAMINCKIIVLTLTMVAVAQILINASVQTTFQSRRLTKQEQRGQAIYLKGISPSGQNLSAVIGSQGAEVPAAFFACANCHGRDGLGRPESGVYPSNLTWESLTRNYSVTTPSGRKRPPYNERFLKRAITMGLDPAGNQLQAAMPRFRMSLEDMSDLIAYLKRLGKSLDPGLTETTIVVGTMIPGEGPLAELGQAIRSTLEAYFDEVNRAGGIYGRRIELRACSSSSEQDVKGVLASGEVFAFVSPAVTGETKDIAALFENEETPVIGPVTLFSQVDFPVKRNVFYLSSGLSEQVVALFNFGEQNLKPLFSRIAVITPNNSVASGLPAVVEAESKKSGLALVAARKYSESEFSARQIARELREINPDTVFIFGSSEQQWQLVTEFDKSHWMPNVLLVGSLAGKELFAMPAGSKGKIFVSYPTLPSDRSPAAMNKFLALAQKHNLPTRHLTSQIFAYCGAQILVEGLKGLGRDLSRAGLVSALERLQEFDTGLIPRLTYGPNRRMGSRGAYIVAVDLEKQQLIPLTGWVPAN